MPIVKLSDDETPLTRAIAIAFVLLVLTFTIEIYITASEFYAETPPYAWFVVCGVLAAAVVYLLLKRLEPERRNSHAFALLFTVAGALSSYSLIARLNVLTAHGGLQKYDFALGRDFIWHPPTPDLPDIHVYQKGSEFWQQYNPGDHFQFQIRKGGLGIWMVSMDSVYEKQQLFYKCKGMWDCATR